MKIDRNYLEKRLDYGEQWGFATDTGTPEYLGWILISKRKPPPISAFDPVTEPVRHARWLKRKEELLRLPYHVAIYELKRDVHESDDYEDNDDYRLNENYYVATLDKVQIIIDKFNLKLEGARWRAELDAP